MKLFLFSIFFVIGRRAHANIAPFIKPCRQSDTACLIESAQGALPFVAAGVPELGMLPLDPGTIDYMETNEAGLRLEFKKTTIRGLKRCTVLKLRRYPSKTSVNLKCSVILTGDYALGGQLLILPIEGEGKYKIVIRDIVVKTDLNFKNVTVNGEKYWNVTGWRHATEMPSYSRFRFQNLFKGDKQLSDQIHRFANDNWQDIFTEVAPPITKAIVLRIVEETTKLFSKVPVREFVLEE